MSSKEQNTKKMLAIVAHAVVKEYEQQFMSLVPGQRAWLEERLLEVLEDIWYSTRDDLKRGLKKAAKQLDLMAELQTIINTYEQ
jgi:hypothetical protein